jgi:hypothetical protein
METGFGEIIMSNGLLIYTLFHVALSVVMLVAGAVVVNGLLRGRDAGRWTTVFLIFTFATNASGFGFPFVKLLPSHITSIIALLLLAAVLVARYAFSLSGFWRGIYAGGLVFSLFFDVFVLVAQAFGKIPALKQLAPTGAEPPFAITELVVLAAFVVLTVMAIRRSGRP